MQFHVSWRNNFACSFTHVLIVESLWFWFELLPKKNIQLEDESLDGENDENSPNVINIDDDEMDFTQSYKKRRSSNGEQFKLIETITKEIKENQTKKFDLFQQFTKQSELELFFSSLCKTVEKFTAVEQAKIKIELSNIVGQHELAHLEKAATSKNDLIFTSFK